MNELVIEGITKEQLESAREALKRLYELKEEYATARAYLDRTEMQMAQLYDTVNRVLNHIKEQQGYTISVYENDKKEKTETK